MSGFQSSLGDDDGIAEELAEGQRAISIAEFFEKNKHMLGFDSGARGLVTAIKEAVDNSLDATEEAGILPDIYVEIAEVGDYYKVIVEDNGPGITKEQLPKVFGKLLYGSRFHKREQSLTPDQKLLIRRDGETDLVSIGELCDTYLPDEGAATRPIDDHIEAPAFGRTNHQMNWEPVTHAIRHETAAETHLITTELDRTVEVTGNHSVFSISETGETVEVDAGDLTPGDEIMIPERLPRAGDPVTEINVLNRLDADSLEKSSVVVEGFTEDTRASLSEVTNSRESGIPAEAVIHHGYEQKAAAEGCSLRCYSTGGSDQQRESIRENNPVTEQHGQMTLPVQFETTAPFARLLGRFIATGEVTVGGLIALRQLHPSENKSNSAAVTDGGVALANTLSVRNKGVDNIATIVTTLVESLCEQSGDRRVPEFLFQAPATQQRAFLGGLHGAESPLHTAQSKLTFATDSATLRSQISVLWSMCGVSAASPDKSSDDGVEHQILVDSSQIRDPAAESSQEASNTAQTTAVEETSDLLAGTDMQLLEVESVEQTDPPEYVYDISVPGASGHDENFVVANDGPISVKNSRGQQGIGISAAVLYSQLTSGKPAKITSRPKGADTAQYFELIIDTDTNEPEIKADTETSWDRPHGTRIELEMEANMRARQQLHDYIQHTAVVNPHARVELREPKLAEPLKFERATDQLPDETHEIRPHPHGVELGTLIKMLESSDSYSLSGFLQTEFTRVGTKTADSVSDAFRDRHYGRELSWPSPAKDESVDIVGAVKEAVSNKGATATTEFAESVATAVSERNRVAHHQVIEIIQNAADEIAAKHDRTFGKTVRNNAVDAAWGQISAFGENDTDGDDETAAKPDRITPDVYTTVDSATGQRKDDATVTALSEAIARRLINRGGEKGRLTDEQLSRVVSDAAEFVIEQRDATIGETAQENIREALDEMMVTVPDDPPKITDIAADRNTANDLLDAMQATDILSPPTDCLAPITADLVDAGLRKEFDADFFAAATRDADVHGGDPFIVEAGIAYGGEIESGSVDVMRFANRVPLVYQRGACATTDVIKRIGWRNYGLDQSGGSGIPSGNAVIMIHVASTNVPFTSESKDAIANVPEMEDEIELAIREASRDLKSYLNKRRSLEKRREKQDVLGRILPEMADKVSEVTERNRPTIDGAMARIMNNLTVQREHEDDEVSISIHNYSDATETPEITDILETEPVDLSDGASAVEMDDEWFVSWEPSVSAGDTAELTYSVSGDPDSELMIDGVDQEKLTIDT